jgi:hypothetical protein
MNERSKPKTNRSETQMRHGVITLKLDQKEEHFRIPSHVQGLTLFLRYLPPNNAPQTDRPKFALYVHGATFPSAHRGCPSVPESPPVISACRPHQTGGAVVNCPDHDPDADPFHWPGLTWPQFRRRKILNRISGGRNRAFRSFRRVEKAAFARFELGRAKC